MTPEQRHLYNRLIILETDVHRLTSEVFGNRNTDPHWCAKAKVDFERAFMNLMQSIKNEEKESDN